MIFTIILSFLGVIVGIAFISVIIGVPCLPTHHKQALAMLRLAEIKPNQTVIDLGCGHGRLLFLATKTGADVIGYELNPVLVLFVKLRAYFKKRKNIRVYCESLFKADVKNADVVFCFLFPKYMSRLENKLFLEMKPGAKIISYAFPFPNNKHTIKIEGVFVYQV